MAPGYPLHAGILPGAGGAQMTGAVRKPRLLVLTSTYPRWRDDPEPGFVQELAKRLTTDFEVMVLAPHARGAAVDDELDGVSVHRYRYAPAALETLVNDGGMVANLRNNPWKWALVPGFLFSQAWATWRLIRRFRPQVIHAHWLLPQGMVVMLLTKLTRVPPFLVTSHGADLYSLRGRMLGAFKRKVARASASMTVVSTAMETEVQRLGLRPPRLEVLPMGVDLTGRFAPGAAGQRQRDRLLFVGRLVPKKGLTHLLDALPWVLVQRPTTSLAIVGFGPEEAALRAQVERLGLGPQVEFLGARPQAALPPLYRSAGLFVAPFVRDAAGDQEGLPVALMEALACGCPVVAGDVAGMQDLLGPTASGVCVDPKDTEALAAAILAKLDDPIAADSQALMLREVVASRVDWKVIAAGYARVLKACIEAPAETGNL